MKFKYSPWIFSGLTAVTLAGVAQAAIVEFDLSPTGTSPGVGLSPANAGTLPTPSTGSGGEVSQGIIYNTDTNLLSLAFGYGSAAGFTDLTSATTQVHIHGPAAVGASGPVVVDLADKTFTASPATKGGVVVGSVSLTDAQETALLGNLHYVNVHTSSNPEGELRAQLIRSNVAPVITCEPEITVECGTSFTFNANVSDFDAHAVSVVFTLNGETVKTVNIAAGSPPAGQAVSLTTQVHNDVNLLTITATDSAGKETICDVIVKAQDTIAPVITDLTVSPKVLWPPNHKLVPVTINANVKDACGDTTYKIVSIKSSQPADGKGDGKTAADFVITGDHTAKVRAERSGKGKEGRTYTLSVQATDGAGNKSPIKTVTVTVPHNQGKR